MVLGTVGTGFGMARRDHNAAARLQHVAVAGCNRGGATVQGVLQRAALCAIHRRSRPSVRGTADAEALLGGSHSMKRLSSVALLALLPIAASVACSGGSSDPASDAKAATPAGDAPDLVPDRPFKTAKDGLVTPVEAADAAEVSPGRLTFKLGVAQPFLDAIVPGKALIGSRSHLADPSKNPDGFMARVTAKRIEGDRVVLDTTPAGFPDVFEDGSFHLDETALALDPASAPAAGSGGAGNVGTQGWSIVDKTQDIPIYEFRVPQTEVVVKGPFMFGSAMGKLRFVDGGVKLGEKVSYHVTVNAPWQHGPLLEAGARLVTQLEANLDIEALIEASAATSIGSGAIRLYERKIPLADAKISVLRSMPLDIDLTLSAAAVVTVDAVCGFVASGRASVKGGFDGKGSFGLGYRFSSSDGLTPDNPAPAFEIHPHLTASGSANVRAECSVTPRVGLVIAGGAFFDLPWPVPNIDVSAEAGGGVSASVYARVEASAGDDPTTGQKRTPTCKATAGVRATADAYFDFNGRRKVDKQWPLYAKELEAELCTANAPEPPPLYDPCAALATPGAAGPSSPGSWCTNAVPGAAAILGANTWFHCAGQKLVGRPVTCADTCLPNDPGFATCR
jgi:hypothetical protein